MTFEIPRLTTARLVLREWRADDIDAHAAMFADAEATQFVGGTRDRVQAWRHMAGLAGHWQLRGFGYWVVERADTGAFIGRVGLSCPEGWPGIELGWKLDRRSWGQGFATEAASVALEWAWAHLAAPKVISLIHELNTASVAVAQRLGMRREGRYDLSGEEVLVFAIDAP